MIFNYFLSQRHEESHSAASSDPYNFLLSLRYLKLEFSYATHSTTHFVSLNMSHIGYWKGESLVVQVMKLDTSTLLITICNAADSQLYTILLNRNIEDETFTNSKQLNRLILEIRKLKIQSTASLAQCEGIEQSFDSEKSSGMKQNFSLNSILIMTIMMTIFARLSDICC